MNKSLLRASSTATRLAIITALLLGVLAAQPAQPVPPATSTTSSTDPKKAEDTTKLDKFEVTGSRIKRVDYETPAPVISFSAQEIENKGYANVGDFIQSLPFNSGTENSIYQTSSFQRGAATTNLRGLGAQRSLTLVNGRRAVPYALVSPNTGTRSVFDFNSLPAAAIESIEYLKDGASAIYGSDAITGVLNIKLKKNFSGLSLTGYYGNTFKNSGGDTGTKQLSAVIGSTSGKTRIISAIDIKTANSNFLRDYGITTTDFSYLGDNKGLNQNSTSNWPANLTLTRAQATSLGLAIPGPTATSWTYVINGGQPTNPTLASFVPAPAAAAGSNTVLVGNENRYNFAKTFEIYPAYDYMSNYTSFEHEINDTLKAFGEITYSKNSTYFAFTPGVITYSTEGLTLPVNNPYNPFGIALTTLSARASFLPVRKFDTESTSANFLGGLRGTVLNAWDWEAAVSYGFSNVGTVSRNAIRASTYQAALNGTLPNFVGKFLNPFGFSDGGLTNALTTVSADQNKAEGLSFDASVAGRLWTLPAGDIGIAAGVEARNDKLQTNPDTSAYLGSGGGSPLTGKRTVTSQYVEISAPLYRSRENGLAVEAQLAGRHEHYSDFGDTTKPKIGVKIRLPDTKYVDVSLRGSYSESFQAPPLGLLYASQTVSFTQGVTQDPLRLQDPPTQLRNVSGGNPNLLPETAKIQYVGAVFETPYVKNLSLTVDFFDIRLNQYIVSPTTAYLLTPNGMAQFPNAVVRDNTLGNPGPILRIETVPANNPAAYQLYRGMDFGVRYILRGTRFGEFDLQADATQILKTGTDNGLGGGFFNNAGYYFNPRWKAQASAAWTYKDYGASVTCDRIGHWYNDGYTAQGWGENPFTIIGAQVRFAGFFHTNLTLGVSNLMNNRPPANGRQSIGFDPNTYGAGVLGRFWSVRVRREF